MCVCVCVCVCVSVRVRDVITDKHACTLALYPGSSLPWKEPGYEANMYICEVGQCV